MNNEQNRKKHTVEDNVIYIADRQQKIQEAMQRHPAFIHQNVRTESESTEDPETWEDTVGSSRLFDVSELTDDEVIAMYSQGRGGEAIERRAKRISDVVVLNQINHIPPSIKDTPQSPEETIMGAIERLKKSIQDLQSKIAAERDHIRNYEVAKLVKKLDERRELLEQYEKQLVELRNS